MPVWFFHFHGISVEYRKEKIGIQSRKQVFSQAILDAMFRPYGELLADVYRNDLGKPVSEVILRNPSFPRRLLQAAKKLLRDNKLVRRVYFKYIKGHTGYNRKQV